MYKIQPNFIKNTKVKKGTKLKMLEQIAKTERNLPPQIWSPQILNTILSVQLFTLSFTKKEGYEL